MSIKRLISRLEIAKNSLPINGYTVAAKEEINWAVDVLRSWESGEPSDLLALAEGAREAIDGCSHDPEEMSATIAVCDLFIGSYLKSQQSKQDHGELVERYKIDLEGFIELLQSGDKMAFGTNGDGIRS